MIKMKMYDWNKMLDDLKMQYGLDTERKLAKFLRLTPSQLAYIRTDLYPPSGVTKAKIWDKSKFAFGRNIFAELLPSPAKEALIAADKRRSSQPYDDREGRAIFRELLTCKADVLELDWLRALDRLKERKKLKTERELSKLIDVYPSALANVREGFRNLPPQAKINLLAELDVPLEADVLLIVVPQTVRHEIRDNIEVNQFYDVLKENMFQ